AHEKKLTDALLCELREINGVTLYGRQGTETGGAGHMPVVSLNIANADCAEVAMILDTSFDIAVRAGLHCAPDAHRTLGTDTSGGTVRISPGYFNTEDDMLRCADALREITAEYGN
ncbi:MAG: aminotransferase class V-fold PLP-dependent enzyme, partial [Clostridiales Family XIII bacterium]|nr:aminotransferase class V-fold PLP-dependent enzyme [Clostridiales Family XIII bacterium]